MLNWIKYAPLEWRKREIYCTPCGPSFAIAKPQTILIGGSRLTISAPPHRPVDAHTGFKDVGAGDALAQDIAISYGRGVMANQHWGFMTLFGRSWAFWGPWMTGAKAQLTLRITLVGRTHAYAYGSGVSFFHPRAFESALADYLDDRFGHEGWSAERSRFVGPLNWQRHDHLPVFSASFQVFDRDNDSRNADTLHEKLFVFPITSNRFIEIAFSRGIFQLENWNEPSFDIFPVDELEKSILDSLHLELGPETQAELDNAKAQFGDISLSDKFPPLQWPTGAFVPTSMHPDDQAVLDWLEREQQASQHSERKLGSS